MLRKTEQDDSLHKDLKHFQYGFLINSILKVFVLVLKFDYIYEYMYIYIYIEVIYIAIAYIFRVLFIFFKYRI